MSLPASPPVALILGVHRSGTSALAGALVQLGFDAGGFLLPATADNANGYFEDARLVAASDQLLASRGQRWDSVDAAAGEVDAAMQKRGRDALAAAFSDFASRGQPCVVKDPRACRLVPDWLAAVRASGLAPFALLMVRHPDEVIASLQRRDGFSRHRARLLWLGDLLEAEAATRGVPRAFVAYDALVDDPHSTLALALADFPGAGMQQRLAQAEGNALGVQAGLRRQRHGDGRRDSDAGSAHATPDLLLDAAWTLARACAGVNVPDDAPQRFDRLLDALRHEKSLVSAAVDDARATSLSLAAAAASQARWVHRLEALDEAWREPAPRAAALQPRLYVRAVGEEFSEAHSVAGVELTPGRWRFDAKEASGTVAFRLDPDVAPGAFELDGLTVQGQAFSEFAKAPAYSGRLLPDLDGRALLLGADADPWLAFDLSAPHAGDALVVEAGIRRRSLPSLLWALAEREAGVVASVSEVRASVAVVAASLNAADAVVEKMAASIGALDSAQRRESDALLQRVIGLSESMGEQQTQLLRLNAELSNVSAAQQQTGAWMLRRSFGYWWQRFTGRKKG